MPRIEDIESFKKILNSLGSEPEIRAQKSETIEEVSPTEGELPSDISEFLDLSSPEAEPGQTAEASLEERSPGRPGVEETPETGAGLDFESLFGEEAEPPSLDEIDRQSRRSARRKQEAQVPPELEPSEAEPAPEVPPLEQIAAFAEGETGPEPDKPAAAEPAPVLEEAEPLIDMEAAESASPQPAEALPPEGQPAAEEAPFSDSELSSLLADLGEMEVVPADETEAAETAEGTEPRGEPAAEEEFSLEDSDLAGLIDSGAQTEAEEAQAPGPPPGARMGKPTAFEELEQSKMLEMPEVSGQTEQPELPEEALPEDLGLPDVSALPEDLGLPPALPEGSGELEGLTEAQIPGTLTEEDLGLPTPSAVDEAPPSPEAPQAKTEEVESVELPDLEDMLGEALGETRPARKPVGDREIPQTVVPAGAESLGDLGDLSDLGDLGDLDLGEGAAPKAPPRAAQAAAGEATRGEATRGEATRGEAARGQAARGEAARGQAEELGGEEEKGFALPESSARFGIVEGKKKQQVSREKPKAVAQEAPTEELGAAETSIELTQEEFSRIKKTLELYPRNLKIAVQDLIGQGKASGDDLRALIALLVAGASAQDAAALAGRISGKRIRIPAGYEKKSALALEMERRTFAYALRVNVLPILRLFALGALATALVGFLGYRFVYRPIFAYANYRRGYEQISGDRFQQANETFARATGAWPMKSWFYKYAEAFRGKQEYVRAEEKYDELLRRFASDRKGILDYARMETEDLAGYEKADSLLRLILDAQSLDYQAGLASGDNFLAWAETEPARYEDARVAYATLIQGHGAQDELLFRMLRYFIRTDTIDEVEALRQYFADRKGLKVDAEAFAELGGYLVDKGRLDYVQDVLFQANQVKPELPEIHYALARYYNILKQPGEEEKALKGALTFLDTSKVLTPRRLTMQVDSHTRLGELNLRAAKNIDARNEFDSAIALVEDYQTKKLIGRQSIFGRPYADLADLNYYVEGNLATAMVLYQKAMANSYTSPAIDFKIGNILYTQEAYRDALLAFSRAEQTLPPGQVPPNLLYAMGNAFYQRGDLFVAQGYYLRFLDKLTTRKAAIGLLQPQDQPEHLSILQNLVRADNNLGVVMMRLSERTGDREKRSEALVYLTEASETADTLSRDPETMARSEAKNLPSLNMRGILYPVSGFVLQIYRTIPKDLEALFF